MKNRDVCAGCEKIFKPYDFKITYDGVHYYCEQCSEDYSIHKMKRQDKEEKDFFVQASPRFIIPSFLLLLLSSGRI